MKILLLTKSKMYTCRLLEDLINEHTVVAVVCKNKEILAGTEMEKICIKENIPVIENNEMYTMLGKGTLPEADLAISNTYGRLIKKPLLDFLNGNCINIHCAILPAYKGVMSYNFGILNEENEWGVTAHYINEEFDQGDIIKIYKFPITSATITVGELEKMAQEAAYRLTLEVINNWEKEGRPVGKPQEKTGKYYSREDFEKAKKIDLNSSAEEIERKIRAFYCPPYEGAYIEIEWKHFQLLPLNH